MKPLYETIMFAAVMMAMSIMLMKTLSAFVPEPPTSSQIDE